MVCRNEAVASSCACMAARPIQRGSVQRWIAGEWTPERSANKPWRSGVRQVSSSGGDGSSSSWMNRPKRVTQIRVLTNAPGGHLSACAVARLYRCRCQIESLEQRLESVLHSEVKSRGHPCAALLAFGVVVLAYNVLTVLQSAVCHAHHLQDGKLEFSPFYAAVEIRAHYTGMMMAEAAALGSRRDPECAPTGPASCWKLPSMPTQKLYANIRAAPSPKARKAM